MDNIPGYPPNPILLLPLSALLLLTLISSSLLPIALKTPRGGMLLWAQEQ